MNEGRNQVEPQDEKAAMDRHGDSLPRTNVDKQITVTCVSRRKANHPGPAQTVNPSVDAAANPSRLRDAQTRRGTFFVAIGCSQLVGYCKKCHAKQHGVALLPAR